MSSPPFLAILPPLRKHPGSPAEAARVPGDLAVADGRSREGRRYNEKISRQGAKPRRRKSFLLRLRGFAPWREVFYQRRCF
jgi:hypothetical protein